MINTWHANFITDPRPFPGSDLCGRCSIRPETAKRKAAYGFARCCSALCYSCKQLEAFERAWVFFQGNSAVLFVILVIWSVAHEWKFRGCLTSKSCHLLCLGGAPLIPLLVTTLLRTVDSFAICFEIHDKDYTKPSKISPLWTVTYHSMGLLWPTHTTPLEWSQLWNQTVIIRVELYDMYCEVQTGPRPYTRTPTPH